MQSVLTEEHKKLKEEFNPEDIIHSVLSLLDEKARSVVKARAGIISGKKVTLSQIGQEFHLSRERIRQIERDALLKLSDRLHSMHKPYVSFIIAILDGHGGVLAEATLATELLKKDQQTPTQVSALRLFLRLGRDLMEIKESKFLRSGWALKIIERRSIEQAIGAAFDAINQAEGVMDFATIWKECPDYHHLPQSFLKNAIALSKEIITTIEGQYGLTSWSTINPKNVRDKIYYVLFHNGKPLHFTEITKKISDGEFDSKKVVQPTVHNELIADDRFVLVGRGIYALSQWGYNAGTVEQVIEDVLKNAKNPMTTDEIVSEVLKSRQVKKNTIIINLQIKPQFVKVGKKLYTLSEKKGIKASSDVKKIIRVAESAKKTA